MAVVSSHHRAAMVGNIVEWFDFFNYAYFAPIIATLFFPHDDRITSLILTYGVFSVGFIARPLGGAILGRLGDKVGRKKILLMSIILMGIPTTLIGLLPTYARWGVMASLAMVILRIVQGLAAGGELGGSFIYLVEHAPEKKRGFSGSLAMVSVQLGILLSALVSFILTMLLSTEQLMAWGWRIPFLLGGIFALTGYGFRKTMQETPVFIQTQHESHRLKGKGYRYFKEILQVAKYNMFSAAGFYLIFVYLINYLKDNLHLSMQYSLALICFNLMVLIGSIPLFGYLSDKIGYKLMFFSATIGLMVLTYPLFVLITMPGVWPLILALWVFSVLFGALLAPIPVLITQSIPPASRYFSVSVGFSVSAALCGSATPILILWLSRYYSGILAPSLYLSAMALFSFIVILWSDGYQSKVARVTAEPVAIP